MPIRVAKNGRTFVDASGAPWFWLGDTQWHLLRSFSAADAAAIIANRKAKGFSVLLAMLIGYEADPAPNIDGEFPWLGDDPSAPNERYFEHVDAILKIACEHKMVLVLGVYHKSQERYYTPERAHQSARWISSRYRHVPNIVWSMYPEARLRYAPVVRAIAAGLKEGDDGSHMITMHPDPGPQSSSFFNDEPWLAFNMLQTCIDVELVHPMTAADYALSPVRPVVMAEGGYEGLQFDRYNSPLDIRRQAYWTFLAGGHHVYGHNLHYQVLEHFEKWLDAPGSFHIATFKRIVLELPRWWDVTPDQSIIQQGVGEGIHLAASARAKAGDWAMVYFPSPRAVTIRMDRIQSSDDVRVSWINPVSGEKTRIGSYSYDKPIDFVLPPDWDDAVLLLEAS